MNRLYYIIFTSFFLLNPFGCFAQIGEPISTDVIIQRSRVRILAIGIGLYDKDCGLNHLNSAHTLSSYKDSIAYKYICPSYNCRPDVISKNGRMGAKDVEDVLYKFANDTNGQDVVIIHILGHGDFDKVNKDYFLVCSDGTAVSGDVIRKQIFCMTDKGALVIIFLDTCHAGALFVNHKPDNNSLKGAIAFYPSSKPEQSSLEIERKTLFSSTIFETFSHKNVMAFDVGKSSKFISLGGIEKIIKVAFEGNNNQTPEPMFFSKDGKLDKYIIKYYPIIEKGKIKTEDKNNRFYGGIAVGSNHTPTPFAVINIGLDLKHFRVEAGASFAFTTSDDVYIYNTNGILQNAYNYRGYNFYGRIGYDVMSCFKEESRWEIVPLVGISGNYIAGKQQDGFNGDIGKDATSLMFTANCRFAYDLTNKGRLYLQGTIGCDLFGNKAKVLSEKEYNKNWCKNRPYVEIGLIFKTKLF